MSTWKSRAVATLTWVCVVSAGGLLVWLVVSRVGTGLAGASDLLPSPTGAGGTPTAQPSPTGTTHETRQGSWQGEAGVVTAACTGSRIAVVGAQPEEGVVEVLVRGPKRLVVTFRADERGSATTVTGRCSNGRPQFSLIGTTPDQQDTESSGPESD
jgi:hypothetical protein